MENYRNKQFIHLKLCAVSSSVVKSGDVCPLMASEYMLDVQFACEPAAASAIRWTAMVSSCWIQVTVILLNNSIPTVQEFQSWPIRSKGSHELLPVCEETVSPHMRRIVV